MNWRERNQRTITNLSSAILRFWFSTAAFLFSTFFAMQAIETGDDHGRLILSCVLAGVAGLFSQVLYERFYNGRQPIRVILYIGAFFFSSGYYRYLVLTNDLRTTVQVRTWVILFIFYIASIWMPTLKKTKVTFSKSFLAFLKAHFTSFLLSLVMGIGACLVLGAFHFLIMDIEYTWYFHILAFSWFTFFPLYVLSLLPVFPIEEEEGNEKYNRSTRVPKFLEVLLSYIVVPLIVAYTLILLLYILTNITGEFWNDNLLEPLLVSYAIAGWITLFLIESVHTDSARLFKLHFPKLLLVVVFFQTVSSFARVWTYGLTHGRYFVLMFGVFSILSSVYYSFIYEKRNVIPGLLIALSIVSISPYIDAVSVGIRSQSRRLENTLIENEMLINGEIQPDGNISEREKEIIIESVDYLRWHGHAQELDYLESIPRNSRDFEQTFGFNQFTLQPVLPDELEETELESFEIRMDEEENYSIEVTDSDLFIPLSVSQGEMSPLYGENWSGPYLSFDYEEVTYQVEWLETEENIWLVFVEEGQEVIEMNLNELRELSEPNEELQVWGRERLTFIEESEDIRLTLLVMELSVEEDSPINGEMYLLVEIN